MHHFEKTCHGWPVNGADAFNSCLKQAAEALANHRVVLLSGPDGVRKHTWCQQLLQLTGIALGVRLVAYAPGIPSLSSVSSPSSADVVILQIKSLSKSCEGNTLAKKAIRCRRIALFELDQRAMLPDQNDASFYILYVPTLKERPSMLIRYLDHWEKKVGLRIFDSHLRAMVMSHPWQGNDRELFEFLRTVELLWPRAVGAKPTAQAIEELLKQTRQEWRLMRLNRTAAAVDFDYDVTAVGATAFLSDIETVILNRAVTASRGLGTMAAKIVRYPKSTFFDRYRNSSVIFKP